MNEETARKWFQKADNDYKTGSDELATSEPATDTICFHAQQCIEKYLKGFLACHSEEFDKTHNITILLKSCIKLDPSFSTLEQKNIDRLTPYATTYRYPDDFYMPSKKEAEEALAMADEVRKFIAATLPFLSNDAKGDNNNP